MQYTSAEANKLLRKLNDRKADILSRESQSDVFQAAVGEDVESVRPAYDFAQTQTAVAELDSKVRKVKHAINLFNVTTEIPGFDMTIDQALVYMAQLSQQVGKLGRMRNRLPKQRAAVYAPRASASLIDYDYANYDIEEAAKLYEQLSDTLARLQTALDLLNSTVRFEIDVEEN